MMRQLAGPGIWNGTFTGAPATYGDAVAWGFVLLLAITLTAFALAVRAIRQRPPGQTPEQDLMDEVRRNEDGLASGAAQKSTSGAPWERDPDWWR